MEPLASFRAGLASVTFRKLPAETVARLAAEAGLAVIEWGGDIHVPHGELAVARATGALSRELGLATTYGSYYRVGVSEEDGLAFSAVLDSAVALSASTIRVWAGNRGSSEISDRDFDRAVADARRVTALAATAGIRIAFERHGGTLTDTDASHRRLLAACRGPDTFTYWQPDITQSVAENVASLHSLLPRLAHVHVFFWSSPPVRRWPLAAGAAVWAHYCEVLRTSRNRHDLLLEFVADDDPLAFRADAATLRRWVEALNVLGASG